MSGGGRSVAVESEIVERASVFERVRRSYARERAKLTGGWYFRKGKIELAASPFLDRFNGLFASDWPESDVEQLWLEAVSLYLKTGFGMFVSFGPGAVREPLQSLIEKGGAAPAGFHSWVYLDLERLREFESPAGLRIVRIRDFRFYEKQEHPWLGPPGAPYRDAKLHFWRSCGEGETPRLWQFVALYQRRLVGSATVFVCGREIGFFDVVVEKRYRRKGIGSEMMLEACRFARESGMRAAGLAAEGEAGIGLYAKLGFVSAGICEDFYLSPSDLVRISEEREISILE